MKIKYKCQYCNRPLSLIAKVQYTSNSFFEILHMGNQCLSKSLKETYRGYLTEVKVPELKDLWQAIKIYKMKKLFDSAAIFSKQSEQSKLLTFQGFKKLFPQLQVYSEKQKHRLYEFFDLEEKGYVDWNNFYSAVTILYFASEKTLAVIMFMMFDHTLSLNIDSIYLKLMLDNNEAFFKLDEYDNAPEIDELHKQLMKDQTLSIQKWLEKASDIIDFSKFRKVFNIFMEEKMEKQLVHKFYDWNEIYNEEKQKYIGYLVSLKWFQSWKLYIYHHYNVNIDIYTLTKPTIRTVKTCKKTFNKMGSTIKIGIDSSRALHGCRAIQLQTSNQKARNIKNIDCVHNHLGERPREIANSQLQGQFQEVLRVGVSQNMDYVIVSEKIWNHLKGIYDGFPEFRRSGFDTIQLYPKIVKAYFSLFKGHLDYSSQVIREVSAYLAVNQLLIKSCQIEQQILPNKIIYFKTIGMSKWEQIEDYNYLFTELSSQVLIFLVCINKEDREIFQKSHLKQAKDVTQVNLGDYLIHKSSSGEQKRVLFMGKSIQGKYILHIAGQSYSSDICLIESDLIKTCAFAGKVLDIGVEKKVIHSNLQGLPSGPGLGFINSVFEAFINNKEIVSQLIMMNQGRNDKLIYNLANIHNLITKQARIQFGDIKNTVELFMGKYLDFQVSQSFNFLTDFYDCITQEIKDQELPNFMNNFEMQIEKTVYCKHCKSQTTNIDECKILSVPISQDKTLVYDVLWVPANIKSNEIIKYKIKVQKDATLDDFINSLEEEIGIKEKAYIITEVFGSDIIKNYHSAQRNAKLKSLKMRETDQIYVYQLLTDLSNFVKSHFNTKWEIDDEELKKQMLIDCKHPQKGWIFGKVTEIEYLPYTQTSIVKVIHKFNKNQSWQVSYDVFQQTIGRFPLRSYDNADHFHLRMHQRVFNEASNSMLLVNMPLITLLPGWMRWKEFFYLVYQQIRHFIAPQYQFSHEEGKQKIGKSLKKINKKVDMVDLFKQYKNSSKFPYKLHLIDFEGRCAICYKFLKLVVYKGENQLYCQGCELSQLQPIAWQVKPSDLLVCIDWYGTNRFQKAITKQSQDISALTLCKKNEQSLVSCLDHLNQQNIIEDEALCCNIFSQKKIRQKIMKAPEILTIYLQRIVEEEDGFKKVVKKIVKIPLSKLQINGSNYRLFAATSIQGQHLNIRHKTYILKGGQQWYEYDGKLVRVVDSKYVESVCVLVLYYQKCQKV